VLGILVGLICAMTWAGSSSLLKPLTAKLDPFALNGARTLVGGFSMFLLTLFVGHTGNYQTLTLPKMGFLFASVILGGGVGDVFYLLSLRRIGVARAFPIASTYPALTLIFAALFLNDPITLGVIAGLVLVLGGIMLISRPKDDAPRKHAAAARADLGGVLMALVASAFWAAGGVLVAPGIQGLDPIMVASVRTPALSLVLLGIVTLRKTWPSFRTLTRREWVLLVVTGFLGWGAGSVLFLWTVALTGAARAAILTSTAPLFALPLSVLFLKEKVTRVILAGTALTVVGVILVS
jgi:drug/metabolite transporter (DMT)-like permease